jgi:hypothetical protein
MISNYIAFAGRKKIATGDLLAVAREAKKVFDQDQWAQVLLFDDTTSNQIDVDWSGTLDDVLWRLEGRLIPTATNEIRRPGRPRLGVVAREVTLLPRHWEWLATQPGGASVALRKLVEQARNVNQGKDRQRQAQESAYRFLSAMAGNEPGFEEATRSLFAANQQQFETIVDPWPADIRDHARKLAAAAFDGVTTISAIPRP